MADQTETVTQPRPAFVAALAACLFILTALPALLVDELFLIDYPEHLAMFHTIENLPQSTHLQAYFELKDGFYPYWGIRAIMGLLAPVLGNETAMQLFAVLALLMPAAGACVLGWTLAGRLTLAPLASLLFVYNGLLNWGFLNFMFSTGIAMMVFAAWIASERHKPALRYGALVVMATGLIWLHPLAAVVLGVLVGLWELANWVRHVRKPGSARLLVHAIVAGLCFLPALISLLLLTDFEGSGHFFHMGHRNDRLWIALMPFWMDRAWWNLLLGLLCLLALLLAIAKGFVQVGQGMPRFVIYLIVTAFAAPVFLFGVYGVNLRLPVFVLMTFVAGCAFSERAWRRQTLVFSVFGVLLLAKLAASWIVMQDGSSRVAVLRSAISDIPAGSRVLPIIDKTGAGYPGVVAEAKYLNLSSYFTSDRDAFIPDMFASVGVGYTAEFKSQSEPMAAPADLAQLGTNRSSAWQTFYDYVFVIDFGGGQPDPQNTEQIARGSYFRILRINK